MINISVLVYTFIEEIKYIFIIKFYIKKTRTVILQSKLQEFVMEFHSLHITKIIIQI